MKATLSNSDKKIYEYIPLLVTQSFEEAFKDNPEIAENPQGDIDGDRLPILWNSPWAVKHWSQNHKNRRPNFPRNTKCQ